MLHILIQIETLPSFSNPLRNRSSLAPMNDPTFSPFLKNVNVGRAQTPSSVLIRGARSVSTLQKTTLGVLIR